VGPRGGHARPCPSHERRRRDADAQLVVGHVRGRREHQLRFFSQDPYPEPGLLPVRDRLPPVPPGRRSGRRGSRIRDHRPLRRELRHQRYRRPDEVQRRLRRARSRHDLQRQRRRSRHGPHREGRARLRPALRRGGGLSQGAGAHREARGHRRRAGARRPRPRGEVRSPRARHGGQEPRAARLRPAGRVRYEPRLRDVGPRRLPYAHLPHQRRGRRRHAAAGHARR